ncbi:maleylpyruvate isomerase N-terminal domain-containing protein [Antrihabitans cavernicola]|uniref:Mycothiol-dependent maleylpyruvate isomerase metal-binding domain-containing protein n=1 Tax=Antrihabitans cavernicola TaxID=2495913 RepID=A0A5A7SJM0_9NOCA|nr:maleylpyruvate isomerase N-terminal domain-containing protein [Spelaeibacter cavernicola]KAA0024843.1 hypothetical protein FOY51_02625 [Spelaeibacter cavernicola]
MAQHAIERSTEFDAFLQTLCGLPAAAATACDAWTVHDLVAHLAGCFEEVNRHLDAYLAHAPLMDTRGFAEREAEFVKLPHQDLLDSLNGHEADFRDKLASVLDREPNATMRWTGRQMRASSFLTHLRSECALHRWDMAGDDATSTELLGQYELLEHAVSAIGAKPMTARGLTGETPSSWHGRVASPGHPDLLVDVDGGGTPALSLVPSAGEPDIVADQAARLLMCWGRTPQPATRLVIGADRVAADRVRQLLAGY